MSRILVVDDEPNVLTSFRKLLSKDGHDVTTAGSGLEALDALQREALPDLLLMDIRMAGLSGLDTLQQVRELAPRVPVIMMTAYGTTETAIEAMKLGAFDYVLKPFDIVALKALIDKALTAGQAARSEPDGRRSEEPALDDRMVGTSEALYTISKLIGQVAPSKVTVLICGESGTGKELVARAIHRHSQRAQQTFLAVNCAAIPDSLLESELFGYERGAFTGAAGRKPGKFELAHGGTIFLDEIGDMEPATQAKVLRVLQEQTCERLGGREPVRVDVRVIAATNKNLESLVRNGRFREDLYYRLNVVTIVVPPLRERAEDIPRLVQYFLERYRREFGKENVRLSDEALRRLTEHAWPGNVRELENCVKQLVVLAKGGVILPEHVALGSGARRPASEPEAGPTGARSAGGRVDDGAALLRRLAQAQLDGAPGQAWSRMIELTEEHVILEALRRTQGNLAQAAKLLGITRPTLRERMAKYGIQKRVDVTGAE